MQEILPDPLRKFLSLTTLMGSHVLVLPILPDAPEIPKVPGVSAEFFQTFSDVPSSLTKLII